MRKVYIETTIVSYYAARPSRDLVIAARQQATRELWPKLQSGFSTHVSALVFQEAGRGDRQEAQRRLDAIRGFPMLDVDDEARTLAAKLVEGRGIPEEYPEDALHVAVAAVNGMELVVTWNFAHINNPFTRLIIRQVLENEGYRAPEICSPEELLESDQ